MKTLEDIIEEQRAKLAAQGKVGTPVTAETFAIWRAGKLAKRQAEAEARMKELSKKKGGGKGLCKFINIYNFLLLFFFLQLIIFKKIIIIKIRNSYTFLFQGVFVVLLVLFICFVMFVVFVRFESCN